MDGRRSGETEAPCRGEELQLHLPLVRPRRDQALRREVPVDGGADASVRVHQEDGHDERAGVALEAMENSRRVSASKGSSSGQKTKARHALFFCLLLLIVALLVVRFLRGDFVAWIACGAELCL